MMSTCQKRRRAHKQSACKPGLLWMDMACGENAVGNLDVEDAQEKAVVGSVEIIALIRHTAPQNNAEDAQHNHEDGGGQDKEHIILDALELRDHLESSLPRTHLVKTQVLSTMATEDAKPLHRLPHNVPHVKIHLDQGQNEAQGGRDHDDEERVQPDPGIGGALSIHSLGIHSQGNHSDDEVGHKQQQEDHLLSAAPTHISRWSTPEPSLSAPLLKPSPAASVSWQERFYVLSQSVQSLTPTRNSHFPAPPPPPLSLALATTNLGDGEVGSDLVAKLLVAEEHEGKTQRRGGMGSAPLSSCTDQDTCGRLITCHVSGF